MSLANKKKRTRVRQIEGCTIRLAIVHPPDRTGHGPSLELRLGDGFIFTFEPVNQHSPSVAMIFGHSHGGNFVATSEQMLEGELFEPSD